MTDVDTLSKDELLRLRGEIELALSAQKDRALDDLVREARRVADEHGLSIDQIVDELATRAKGKPKPKRARAARRYQHPENPALQWSGMGRRPQWFLQAIEDGRTPEDLQIADEAA